MLWLSLSIVDTTQHEKGINTNTTQQANFRTVDVYARFTPNMPPNQLSLRYHDIQKK